MRLRRLRLLMILSIILLFTGTVSARDVLQGDQCLIPADRTIKGDLFALCRDLIIDGHVEGNVYALAFTIEVNGSVGDSLYLISSRANITGESGGDLAFAGVELVVDQAHFTHDRADLLSLSISTTLEDSVILPGSITTLSHQLIQNGAVGGEINFWGNALLLNGTVSRDVAVNVSSSQNGDPSQSDILLIPFRLFGSNLTLHAPGLIVSESGRIEGDLRYTSPQEAQLDGEIVGESIHTPIVTRPDFIQMNITDEENTQWFEHYINAAIREFITFTVIGLLAVLIFPRSFQAPVPNLYRRVFSSLGIGVLAFFLSFAIWFVVLLILLLLVGLFVFLQLGDLSIMTVMILLAINVGGGAAFYFVVLFISRAVVAYAIGRILVRLVLGEHSSPNLPYIIVLVGSAVLSLLVWLPVVGWVINSLALLLGLGAISLYLFQTTTTRNPKPILPDFSHILGEETAPIALPPPITAPINRPPGMDNLPEGFSWWQGDE